MSRFPSDFGGYQWRLLALFTGVLFLAADRPMLAEESTVTKVAPRKLAEPLPAKAISTEVPVTYFFEGLAEAKQPADTDVALGATGRPAALGYCDD